MFQTIALIYGAAVAAGLLVRSVRHLRANLMWPPCFDFDAEMCIGYARWSQGCPLAYVAAITAHMAAITLAVMPLYMVAGSLELVWHLLTHTRQMVAELRRLFVLPDVDAEAEVDAKIE